MLNCLSNLISNPSACKTQGKRRNAKHSSQGFRLPQKGQKKEISWHSSYMTKGMFGTQE